MGMGWRCMLLTGVFCPKIALEAKSLRKVSPQSVQQNRSGRLDDQWMMKGVFDGRAVRPCPCGGLRKERE